MTCTLDLQPTHIKNPTTIRLGRVLTRKYLINYNREDGHEKNHLHVAFLHFLVLLNNTLVWQHWLYHSVNDYHWTYCCICQTNRLAELTAMSTNVLRTYKVTFDQRLRQLLLLVLAVGWSQSVLRFNASRFLFQTCVFELQVVLRACWAQVSCTHTLPERSPARLQLWLVVGMKRSISQKTVSIQLSIRPISHFIDLISVPKSLKISQNIHKILLSITCFFDISIPRILVS